MKSHKSKQIKILQQDAPVPEIVDQKMEDAFRAIQNGEISCAAEPVHTAARKRSVRRKWSFTAAAVFAVCVVTACTAAYTNWSWSLVGWLQITEGQKQMLEENHAWSVLDQSVTSEGVTVTARQCIADSYCAYISFKIEGYALPEGAWPCMKSMKISAGDNGSGNIYYYADFYQDTRNDAKDGGINEDGILPEDNADYGGFVADDGSLEYQIRILTLNKRALFGKPVHVTLHGLGSRTGTSGPVYDNSGIWEFEWTLNGTADTAKITLNETLGDTGTTILGAEISPISVKYTFERQASGMWPRLLGFRTKDGNMHLNIAGSGISRFYDFAKYRFMVINVTTRIMDAEQIDALVFTDINYRFRKNDPDMHLYTVPIEAFYSKEN